MLRARLGEEGLAAGKSFDMGAISLRARDRDEEGNLERVGLSIRLPAEPGGASGAGSGS